MRQVYERKDKKHHYASLKKKGEVFEILILPDKAIKYRKGLIDNVLEALEVEAVFSDARKGERAAGLEEFFGTSDISVIADNIIKNGKMQLTTEYKNELRERKRREVINIITTNGVDPRNDLPIPKSRVELALDNVNYNFNPFESAEEQVEPVLEKLRPVLPISFKEKIIKGVAPRKFAGKVSGVVNKFGKVVKSEWHDNGSWKFSVKIPGGLQNEFMKKMNNITHGEIDLKI